MSFNGSYPSRKSIPGQCRKKRAYQIVDEFHVEKTLTNRVTRNNYDQSSFKFMPH